MLDFGKIGLTLEGAWSSSKDYEKLSCVRRKGATYVSKDDNKNIDPYTDTEEVHWMMFSDRGKNIYDMLVEEGAYSGTEAQFIEDMASVVDAQTALAEIKRGTWPDMKVGDLIGSNNPVTVKDKFLIRPTAGDESIDSKEDALLLQVIGGHNFRINALRWNGSNALDPNAWASGKTSGYITGAVASGTIGEGTNKLAIIRCPKCEAGEYGTAAKNNGYLITDANGNNLKVGDGTVVGVWYSPTLPASGTEVTSVTEHTFTGHSEKFYLPDMGYMVVEFASAAVLNSISVHLAWSKDYNVFKAYTAPVELTLAVSALTSKFDTVTVNGKTCLKLRGIEQGNGGIFDTVIIYAEGGGPYERNLAGKSLTDLSWTETEIEGEVVEGEGEARSGYRYTASLPTTGTYAAMRDGLIQSDVDGMTIDGFNLVYDSPTQITPATAFAGLSVDYQIATPVTGTHSIDPTGKKPDDMGTEEVVGGDEATGTIVIEYKRGFYDTMRALLVEFDKATSRIEEMEYAKQLYCVGAWLKNANIASPIDQDNANALALFGNKEWALDWRPFLVDMTAVEGQVRKRPDMELKKNNFLRDIYGNFAPVVGITTDMYNECMANALYTDAECTEQYCAAGAYDPVAFLALCSIQTADGVKYLSHPTLYKAADTEVTHYLMPWETTETKYSIFVGRKDTVCLLDNVVGASGKEWNGVLSDSAPVWDGIDLKAYALKPTGICASPMTSIVENQVSKLRSFFFNYNATDSYSKGTAGASGCTMFRNNGHYRTNNMSQISTKNRARANNHVNTNPFPVAEGGYHARNTFLRCLETAWGTKALCAGSRFSGGVMHASISNEETWLSSGGLRYKASGTENWNYVGFGSTMPVYYNASGTKKRTDACNWLTGYGAYSKTMEAQIAVSFAAEFGIAAGEKFIFNNAVFRYENPTASGLFNPKTVAQGEMNCRVYKIVTGSVAGYATAEATETTDYDIEVCVRTGLMLGCDMSGDSAVYWGGGCEMVGECKTGESTTNGTFGHKIDAYIEPDQEKWVNEDNVNVNIGGKFSFEGKYRPAGSIVTRADAYTRRRLPYTPLPASVGGGYSAGDCGYSWVSRYWASAGKRTRVGVRFGHNATSSYLSARALDASYTAGNAYVYFCGSAQVLLDVQ